MSRREMLATSSLGFGSIALSYLLHTQHAVGESVTATASAGSGLQPRAPHFAPRADSVIMLMQNGGPSQMDLFDPKPELTRMAGKSMSVEIFQPGNSDALMATPLKFRHYGQLGVEMAEILPHIGSIADDLCVVRSMYSQHNNHTEALILLNTGKIFPGRPALGAWISYGLGTENQNLPAYVVLRDPEGYNTSGSLLWENGWLPAVYRGTEVATQGPPVRNLQPFAPVRADARRDDLDLIARLNRAHRRAYPQESDLEARIQNYELAARMQLEAGEVLKLSNESPATRRLYGLDDPTTAGYGLRCLMARRLIESGVRFVQVFPPVKPQSQPWDAHQNVKTENEQICARTDLPSAALIKDLKARGLLDRTIVVWSGEFGRLPVSQNGRGRDHNRNAFTLLLAGGGFRAGHVHGATDEVGYRAAVDRVGVPDLHATILHQLGLDHERLTYPYHGSAESLTDARVTNARVVTNILDRKA
jgi:hypothetical protein